jgi:DNA-binding response OmpR family regulator
MKLLTIDDEKEFTILIANYFGPRGYLVFTAYEGETGLRIARKELPDVCLIDLKMPGKHGDEVMKEILQFHPKAKCIMITASEGEGKTRTHLLEMGAYTCFDKPIASLKILEQTIREAVFDGKTP